MVVYIPPPEEMCVIGFIGPCVVIPFHRFLHACTHTYARTHSETSAQSGSNGVRVKRGTKRVVEATSVRWTGNPEIDEGDSAGRGGNGRGHFDDVSQLISAPPWI